MAISLEPIDGKNVCILYVSNETAPELLQSGPYFWQSASFYQAFRLYGDPQGAFFSGIIQNNHVTSFAEQRPTTLIPVPPRSIISADKHERPLAGFRFAVKDVVDITGLQKSVGSRAYLRWCPEAEDTADAVKTLISLGAVLVGKTRCTQFTNGEDPQEWIDYDCPWNPRGGS